MEKCWRYKHGQVGSLTYNSWRSMKFRCRNKSQSPLGKYWGARGIDFDQSWLDFNVFLKEMGERPTRGHSLDRIDNTKGYFKENCRWASHLEQQNNRSTNRRITFGGRTQTLAQWSREIGIAESSLFSRIKRGWPLYRALEKK